MTVLFDSLEVIT